MILITHVLIFSSGGFMKTKCSLILVGSLILFSRSEGKVQCAKTEKRLNYLLRCKELSLVCFYNYDRRDKNCCKCSCDEMHDVFKSASSMPKYKAAEIQFIEANIALPSTACIAQEYDICSTPTFVLFKDGDPYCVDNQQIRLEGQASKADLMALLDENADDIMRRIIETKEEIRERQLAENLYWYNYYGFPWYGYCPMGYASYYCGPSCWYPWYNSCGCSSAYVNVGFGFCR